MARRVPPQTINKSNVTRLMSVYLYRLCSVLIETRVESFVNTVKLSRRAYSYTSVSLTVTRWRGGGVSEFFIDEAVLEADPPRTIESSVGFA